MSSARSIAAARNRRAGDNSNPNPMMAPGPGKSTRFIPGQMPPQQPQMQPQQMQRPPAPGSQYSREPMIPVKSTGASGPVGQISISDAFALVTIRLGKVEQYVQQLQEAGLPDSVIGEDVTPGQVNPLDIQVINEKLNLHDQQIKTQQSDPRLQETVTKMEKEVRDLKDMLFTLTMKTEKMVMEHSVNLEKMNQFEGFMENVNGILATLTENQQVIQQRLDQQSYEKETQDEEVVEEDPSNLNSNQLSEEDLENLKTMVSTIA